MRVDELLSALLADVTRARVSADEVARNLAETYRQDPILRAFPVPRATINHLELELAFAVKAVDAGGGGRGVESADERVRRAVRTALGAPLTQTIRQVIDDPSATGDGIATAQKLFRVREDAILARARKGLERVFGAHSDSLGSHAVREETSGVLRLAFASEARTGRMELVPSAETWLAARVERHVDALLSEASELVTAARGERDVPPAVHVLVTESELAAVPEAAISKLRLELVVADGEWVESGSESEVRLMEKER